MNTAMPRPVSAASAAEVGEQLDEVDLDVAGVGPAGDGRHRRCRGSTGRAACGAAARPAAGSRCANAFTHAERVVAGAAGRCPSSRTAWCSAEASGRRSDWSGRASSLPVPHPARTAGRAQRVEQHRLADAAQPGEHDRALGPAAGDPLEHDVEGVELLVATGQLGRPLAGAGGVGFRIGSTIGGYPAV